MGTRPARRRPLRRRLHWLCEPREIWLHCGACRRTPRSSCRRPRRPAKLSAVVKLETFTQPGCVISGCRTTKLLGVLPQEDCFNRQAKKAADQPDGKSVKIDFGGVYYEHLPSGELYVKFERKNYLTGDDTCTYEIRSGYKRWF
ncbi:hypothetical protein PR001_g21443 [Phytophthora rubi]|uniref:Uncharacterized protein n=1 Tax=Phytophthora rubi TaxID=129364 RepID=A0A6A3J8L6_9STRA|nr:hypothetical protein PR002_g21940 [Phytophthora rubi]KAE8990600.1 hypothetical protein PR001_g21443 [Phytophthora rubi]